ncbi:MAG: TonB-dependent siderophore receptor [Pseudotabrizicola sp.]|uniref:TonB-dependent receptor n=1 Tax=Pseudotabrizicola sp. TaxID=2939647 RepID=UPI002720B5ED|nr:TonB-dependent siderophore receptor [Pseudotabrizicola sp.]MDO9638341.1 TonB-dependent siderophore receptor [Pseudotabrizicola sp.]
MTHLIRPHPLLLGASLFALLSSGVLAQEADDGARTTFLGVIVVDGNENPTAPLSGPVARTAATTKTATPITKAPASISVIPNAQMREQGATNLAEALSYSAGVITENYGGDPRFDSLYLRGFNLENDKFLDGLRLMRSTQYPTSAPTFELYGIERAEVLRGPASVLYGAGTPAGLVNMVQKRAQASGDFTELGVTADSNGSVSVYGDANRVVDDRFAYRITTKVGNSRTDVKKIDNERAYLGISASYALNDSTELEFMVSHHDDAPMSPTGVPNGFVGVYGLKDMRDFNFGDTSVNTSDRKMSTLSFGATHDFGNGWKLNGTFRYTDFDWVYRNVYVSGSTGSAADRGVIDQGEDFDSLGFDLRLAGIVSTGAIDHSLTFGLDAQKFKERAYTGFSTTDSIDFTAPAYGGLTISAPWYVADKTVDAQQYGLYALDEMSWGNWRATVGLRHDWTEQTGASITNFGNTDYARRNNDTTGHVSLGYSFENGVNAYLDYATSFLPQPGMDIDGNALNPTKGRQLELGVKYEPTAFDGLLTASLFKLEETDRNTTVTETVGGGTITGTRQIGKAAIQGLELEGVADLGNGWTGKTAYTYASTNITGTNDGNELANTPRHAGSVWISHQMQTGRFAGLTFSGGLRHIGTRWSSDDNTTRLKAVTLVDLGASYSWDNGMNLQVNLNNVTDEAYVSAVGFSSSYIGDGRNLQANLSWKW